ncbi:MAG: hemolysin family protein [Gammaproteobacteria bacterium]|jgi:CBS domain containing-hemolysin-like protein
MISLLITFFLLSIIASFLCSLWEATLLSITPSYAQVQMQDGSRTGRQLQGFKANVDRPLAAILTLNTIAHTVGAIGVGAQATLIWSDAHPMITSVLVPTIMTLAILILSEIIPKTLGAVYWQRLAPFTANAVSLVIRLLYPLVWLSQGLTRLLKSDEQRSVFSHSEFLAMVEIGVEEGHVERRESEIIGNLLSLSETPVRKVMTPRTVVTAAPESQTIGAFHELHPELPYSRIPLFRDDNPDHVTGYVLKGMLLTHLLQGSSDEPLSSIRREILAVPETFPIREMFDRFLQTREHIALVVDEFGGMAGIVTMEDLVETLLGAEIIDELDEAADLREVARRKWRRRVDRHGLIRPPAKPDDEG